MTTAGTTPAPEQSAVSARATTEESAFISRVDVLAEGIKSGIKSGQGEPAQHELARLAVILRDLYDGTNLAAIARAEIVAKALFQDEPDLVLARECLDSLEYDFRPKPWVLFLFGGSPPRRVILGLGSLLYVGLPTGFWIFRSISGVKEVLGINVSMLIGVALAGALGSIVSIMVRLQDFVSVQVRDPIVIFFYGIFQAHHWDELCNVRLRMPQCRHSPASDQDG